KMTFEVIDFEMRDAVESTVEMLAEHAQKKGLDLACWFDPDVPNFVRGDPSRFRQVLANLLSNAVKFTQAGEVLVRVSKSAESEKHFTVKVAVSDTGVGIETKAISKIFEAFTQADGSTTRRFGGTGLGLTISKQLVELMHGEMGVESNPGKGSTFWFTLPLERSTAGTEEHRNFESGNLAGLRVLVVDDNPSHRDILRRQLGSWKISETQACDGPETLQVLRGAAAAGQPYNLVLLDMDMKKTDGLSLAEEIKKETELAGTRLLVMTPLGQRLDAAVMQSIGISACLAKPIRQSRLFDCMVEVMSGSGTSTVLPMDSGTDDPRSRPAPLSPVSVRILIAEDNMVNQRLALRQLKKLGYNAEAVGNGKEVLEALQRIPYDIILMDCQMPEMDGYEVTRRIRSSDASGTRKAVPYVIALTANALQGDREKCFAAGMNDYLTKPLHLNELEGVLEKAMLMVPAGSRQEVPERAVLDMAIIAGLRDLREPGQPDPLKELIELFLKDAKPRIEKMRQAKEQKDAATLASAAHTLKGSASNLGAKGLAALCSNLEKAGKANELTEAANILLDVTSEFQSVEKALIAEMQK
ncbi:MAG TPA: response regulator, partial [Candidatus Saccharimonadales bacterium]|nr:response regulator [Candidatus Saccharimonadales bacterium]